MNKGRQWSDDDELYHGTNVELKPGDKILPAAVTGNSVHGDNNDKNGQPSNQYAHATRDEGWAWMFSDISAHRPIEGTGVKHADGGWSQEPETTSEGRTRVYTLHPHSEQRKGVEHWHGEVIAPHFVVKDEVLTKGLAGRTHRQGTLPADWGDAGRAAGLSHSDHLNHPSGHDDLDRTMRQRELDPKGFQKSSRIGRVYTAPETPRQFDTKQTTLFPSPKRVSRGRPPRSDSFDDLDDGHRYTIDDDERDH